MTRDEFLLAVDGKAAEIDTFDAVCPEGARPELKAISPRGVVPGSPRAYVASPTCFSRTCPRRCGRMRGSPISGSDNTCGISASTMP